ncbi:hypothetical protein RND71_019185 [Anisodus tanguticus]|uniref:Uncharacterized protein n=1 Tax=Anisodus tanguticus TaxID=243964 RepID=A0AAE1V894_9SOLA|nr:hypothetical protein RND71_019185 [Anisodus tanguticus]
MDGWVVDGWLAGGDGFSSTGCNSYPSPALPFTPKIRVTLEVVFVTFSATNGKVNAYDALAQLLLIPTLLHATATPPP